MSGIGPISKAQFKVIARQYAKENGIKPTHAHELVAKFLGFRTYNSYLASLKNVESISGRSDP